MADSQTDIYATGTVTVTDDLEKIVFSVGQDDLQSFLRAIASQAINEQIQLGNPITNLIVDGSGVKAVAQAQKVILAYFTDTDTLRQAIYDGWRIAQSLTRVLSGRAQLSYQLWYNNTPIGSSPGACEIYLDRMVPSKDFFRIVGPLVVYGRKLYWNPATNGKKQKFTKRKIAQVGNTVFKVVRTKGIMDQVADQLKRKYKGLAIANSWVTTSASALPKDGRTPALYLGFKKRGAIVNG